MLTIFTYHSVMRGEYMHAIDPNVFEEHIKWLASHTKMLTLDEIINFLEQGTVMNQTYSACMFDDGFLDNYKTVLPIIKKYNIPITIFICVSRVGTQIKDDLGYIHSFMNWEQLRAMRDSGLVSFGSHTMSHPLLTLLDDRSMENELLLSKEWIEKELNVKICALSYPKGNCNQRVKEFTKKNYQIAFGGVGSIKENDKIDWYEVPRIIMHKNFSFMRMILMCGRSYWFFKSIRDKLMSHVNYYSNVFIN